MLTLHSINPKYGLFWHVFIWTDVNNKELGRTRAQIKEVKFNSILGENVYFLETYSKQATFKETGCFIFVPTQKLKITRLESQIIARG